MSLCFTASCLFVGKKKRLIYIYKVAITNLIYNLHDGQLVRFILVKQ